MTKPIPPTHREVILYLFTRANTELGYTNRALARIKPTQRGREYHKRATKCAAELKRIVEEFLEDA